MATHCSKPILAELAAGTLVLGALSVASHTAASRLAHQAKACLTGSVSPILLGYTGRDLDTPELHGRRSRHGPLFRRLLDVWPHRKTGKEFYAHVTSDDDLAHSNRVILAADEVPK